MPQLKRRTPTKPRKKLRRVSVVLTEGEYARLTQMAASSDRSMSWLGRYAIRKLLEEHEGRQLPLGLEMPEGA